MALANYLAQIKSAGIYRFVWDKSEMPPAEAQTMRLVAGYSEKGPFNTPVYVESKADFKKIFGAENKKLERYGVFFHRMALQALEAGPILALNLKKFTPGVETVQYVMRTELSKGTFKTDATKLRAQIEGILSNVGEVELGENGLGSKLVADPGTSTEMLVVVIQKSAYNDTVTLPGTTNIYVYDPQDESSPVKTPETTSYTIPTDVDTDEFIYIISTPDAGTVSYTYGSTYATEINVEYGNISFVTSGTGTNLNVEDIYNTDRFWSLEPKKLETLTNTANGYLTITATDEKKTSCTMIIRKANVRGYDISFKDWYAQILNGTELPEYLGDGTENMKDYFGEIYVFRGDLAQFAESDSLAQYFENGVVKNYITNAFGDQIDALQALAENPNSNFVNKYVGIMVPDFESANGTALSLDVIFNRDNALHNMMMNFNQTLLYGGDVVITDVKLPEQDPKNSDMFYLEGYTYGNPKPASGTDAAKLAWHKTVSFAALTDYRGMRIGLTDRTSVEYHYLVDTWESYIPSATTTSNEIKAELALIAKEKDNALAILNFPAVESVRNYEGAVDPTTNQIKWQEMIDNHTLALASVDNGASWAGYYSCVSLRNPATQVKFTCPSAALVSNDYMAKYVTRLPYSIVAGPNYGIISDTNLVGPDYNFSRSELDVLEPFGVNCLIYAPRVGTYINAQQTAKQNPVTALSKISTRELVIFIQDEIENLLRGYQWEFNTQALRNTIKSKADVILETIKNNGGVYAFINVCDDSNNTDDVINNEMLVLDTSIEPGMGCGKMVQQLTIYRKGGLTSLITE